MTSTQKVIDQPMEENIHIKIKLGAVELEPTQDLFL